MFNAIARLLPALGLAAAAVLYPQATAAADPADPSTWPVADGNFTTTADPGWVFFVPDGFAGRGCGIAPDGAVGCDIVPSRDADGTPVQAGVPGPPGSYSCGGDYCPLPPPSAEQIVAGPQQQAEYTSSDTSTFTRAVGSLVPGYRLVNGDGWCYVGAGSPRSVVCHSGPHGFSVQAVGVRFW
ncbi:MAG: hypothetical protein FGM52_06845 [Mycobacterium sp.]|nr:hypothetical protein [Mycobacterium sp.]